MDSSVTWIFIVSNVFCLEKQEFTKSRAVLVDFLKKYVT